MAITKRIRNQKKKTMRNQKKKTVRDQKKKTVRNQKKLKGGNDKEICVEHGRYKCINCIGKIDPITYQPIPHNDNPMCIDKQCYGESPLRQWIQFQKENNLDPTNPSNRSGLTHDDLNEIIDSPDKCHYYIDSSGDELEEVLTPLEKKRLLEREAKKKYGPYWYMQDNEFTRNQ